MGFVCSFSPLARGTCRRTHAPAAALFTQQVSVRWHAEHALRLPPLARLVKHKDFSLLSTVISNLTAHCDEIEWVRGFSPIESVAAMPAQKLSGPLFDKAVAVTTLRAAWVKVEANQGCAGGDGMTVSRFAPVAGVMLERLCAQLVSGTYRPGPARRVHIRKKGGGFRPLDIPCIIDRIAQGAVNIVLDPVLDPHFENSNFAYRKGRSVARAVARIAALRRQGFTHVVDGDIRAYFEKIPHERLIGKLERLVDDPPLVDLIWLWLETYSLTGRGVPQKMPLSPLLANLYLDSVDASIEARGVRLVRFADDFLILAKSGKAAEKALAGIGAILAGEGLELNPEKTRLVSFEEGFRFLGHVFVRSLAIKEADDDDTPSEDAIEAAEAFLAREAAGAGDETNAPERQRSDPVFPVYVVQPEHRLEARGARLRLIDGIGRIVDLPPGRIDRIELGPDTEATLAALDLAAANAIEITRVNGHGEVLARYEGEGPERARRHLAQARLILDPVRSCEMARLIVRARVHNQRALLRRLNRERQDAEIAAACAKLSRVVRKLELSRPVAETMGVGGEAAALFWPAFGRCFPEPFRFSLRTRRPARNAANLVIGVLSSMLARDVRATVMKAGMHPGFGVLHSARDGEDGLCHDLVEPLRGPVAEACASALFNRKALDEDSFILDSGAPRLTSEGWAAVIRGYEAWVARPVRSPWSRKDVLWRMLMLEQAMAYARHCDGEAGFALYLMDY